MKIQIRATEPTDLTALHEIINCPKVFPNTSLTPYLNLEEARQRLATTSPSIQSLVACVDNRVVGQVALYLNERPRRRHSAILAIMVHDDWQGRGIGKAMMEAILDLADNWLQLLRIELNVYSENQHAIALYQKYGFVIEGTHKNHIFHEGRYVDVLTMARLKEGSDNIRS